MKSFCTISLCVLFLGLALAAMAQITICQGCGWEVDGGPDKCGHCGKAVERKEPAPEPEPEEPEESQPEQKQVATLTHDIINKEVQLARQQLNASDFELARLFLQNAAVLNLISEPESNELRSEYITKMAQLCDSKGLMVQSKCAACGGKGNRVMKIGSLIPGEESSREVQGSKCLICKGVGVVRRAGNMDERKFARGQAERRYVTMQQGRRYTKVGGAWMPGDAAEQLSVKQNAMIRAATADPCEECVGFGKTDCEGCEASGVLKCEACEDGNVFTKVHAELTKMTLSRSEKCKKCRGKGLLLCSKCGGSGGVLCRKCNGNGKRPECAKCAGEGHTGCSKCRGSGKVDSEDCGDCAGEGAEVCSSCKGDGHR